MLAPTRLPGYFNPRSLTGATQCALDANDFYRISIHAPSRERPYSRKMMLVAYWYFNPRSLTGATCRCRQQMGSSSNFNPRSLTGATVLQNGGDIMFIISIHAPSRERPLSDCTSLPLVLFQSTLPHGSDKHSCFNRLVTKLFQSTLPHGSDLIDTPVRRLLVGISIHAPSRERLIVIHDVIAALIISIHAPSRERPDYLRPHLRLHIHFNPRSLTGATYGVLAAST